MSTNGLAIGRLLRSSTSGCVVGCRVDQAGAPVFGSLVRIPLEEGLQVFGLVHDIHIEDDGLVRQLVTAPEIQPEVFADNRTNRSVPVEFSVLHTGYSQAGRISHLLPPKPPLSLDELYLCSPAEMVEFTSAGRFGYFRHVLAAEDLPGADVLAAHIQQAGAAHQSLGAKNWREKAVAELIVLLRDDYPTLMSVLSALADTA